MSIIAFAPVSPPITERLHALIQEVVTGISAFGRSYKKLHYLPDHLLLDIGLDPRDVPQVVDALIARPDLAYSGLAARIFRTVAKS